LRAPQPRAPRPATSTDRKLNAIAANLCKPKGKHGHHDDDDDDDDDD
jgi:hypothetical protein